MTTTILDVRADALADGFDDDERYAKAEQDAETILRRLQEAGAAFVMRYARAATSRAARADRTMARDVDNR